MKIADIFFSTNHNLTLERNKRIIITQNTINFSHNVYRTRDIVGFKEAFVEAPSVSYSYIIILFVLVFAFFILSRVNENIQDISILVALFLYLLVAILYFYNILKPRKYGLLMTLTSGEKKLFVTKDKKGVRNLIDIIYDFLEDETDKIIEVEINNIHVTPVLKKGKPSKRAIWEEINIFDEAQQKLTKKDAR